MTKIDIVNVLGEKVSSMKLDSIVFAQKPHNQAMFDLVLSERADLRQGTHKTKTRTEVSGGGRKPWRQKGTGRARQGSIRSPQWRGGGVVFGPTPDRNYKLKVNRKVKKLALRSGWTLKYNSGAIAIIDNVSFKTPSTKDFKKMLSNIKADNKKVMFILEGTQEEWNTYLSGKNLTNVLIVYRTEVLLDDILNSDKIVMTKSIIEEIQGGLK